MKTSFDLPLFITMLHNLDLLHRGGVELEVFALAGSREHVVIDHV